MREKVAQLFSSWPGKDRGIALVGMGQHMESNLLPALRMLKAPVSSLTTRNEEKAHELAARALIPESFGSLETMLERARPNAAIVAAGAERHPAIIKVLSDAQIPVFVEKPVAPSLERLTSLRKDLREDAIVMVGFQKRFAPTYRHTKKLITEGHLGTIHHVHVQINVGPLLPEVDPVLEVGIHMLDLIVYFLGGCRVAGVHGQKNPGRRHIAALLESEKGVSATVQVSEMGEWNQVNERVEVTGEGHRVIVDNIVDFRWQRPTRAPCGQIPDPPEGTLTWTPNFTVPVEGTSSLVLGGFVGELAHFFESLHDATQPDPDLDDAALSIELVEKINKAIKR